MNKAVEQNLSEIKQLMQHYGVQSAFLFGSTASDTMRDDSDIDFIIKFEDDLHYTTYAENYFALADALEALLKRDVELVTEKTLKNPYLLQSIEQNKLRLL